MPCESIQILAFNQLLVTADLYWTYLLHVQVLALIVPSQKVQCSLRSYNLGGRCLKAGRHRQIEYQSDLEARPNGCGEKKCRLYKVILRRMVVCAKVFLSSKGRQQIVGSQRLAISVTCVPTPLSAPDLGGGSEHGGQLL